MRIKAIYSEDEFIPELEGNPLTEALPHIEGAELLKILTHIPEIPDNFQKAPQYAKEFQLRKLKKAHIPQAIMTGLYESIYSAILDRYNAYHPMSAKHMRKQLQLAEVAVNKVKFSSEGIYSSIAPSMLVDGQSGSGKTTLIRSTLHMLPQVIEHESYKGRLFRQDQLVWVSFDLPSTASKKALALNFFKAVDAALGIDKYHKKWSEKPRESVDSHLNAMQLIAETHHIGIIHIDEIQFMLKYPQGKDTPSFAVLEALFNKLGVPVILSTTTQGLALFDTDNGENQFVDMTTTRRMLSERQFTCKIHKAEDKFFNQLFDALFPPQVCTEGKPPGREFRLRFHRHSCGLPFMMVRLAHLHHETIFRLREKLPQKAESIQTDDIDSLNKTYNKQFRLIHRALENLRNGNDLAFEKLLASKGGINKFFDEAKENERKKQIKNLTPSSSKGNKTASTKSSQVTKTKSAKVNPTDEFDGFLTGMGE
jgi:hypothetical protein